MNDSTVVIGTGAAGLAAARPLIESGARVILVDAGTRSLPAPARPPLAELRRGHADAWRYMIGEDLRGLRSVHPLSPKLRLAPSGTVSDYLSGNSIAPSNFAAIGALLHGGLTNFWGAVTFAYGRREMAGWPINDSDLAPFYRSVSERIGISGPQQGDLDDAPPPLTLQPPIALSPLAAKIYDTYQRSQSRKSLKLGLTRLAVLSQGKGDRQPCEFDNGCFYGCPVGAVYSAGHELRALAQAPGVELREGVLVDRLSRDGARWTVHTRRIAEGGADIIVADRVILAAGALASTRLVLDTLDNGDALQLESNPSCTFAVWFPRSFGWPLPVAGFGLTQLAISVPLSDDPADEMICLLYPASAMSATDLITHMPFTRPGSVALMRELGSSVMVALAYFPGRYSRNSVRLDKTAAGSTLRIDGAYANDFQVKFHEGTTRLRRAMRQLGGWVLPGSVSLSTPGAEVHYGGSLAMGRLTDRLGEVLGAPGLTVADGAILPSMPARNPTLTIMANAARIGSAIAGQMRA